MGWRRVSCLRGSAVWPGICPSFLGGSLFCSNGRLAIRLGGSFSTILIVTRIDIDIGSRGFRLSCYGIRQRQIYLSSSLQHWNTAKRKVFFMEF